jgi:general secretion pathway protein I
MFYLIIKPELPVSEKNSGFTLLEVMIAIAILGISLVMTIQLFTGALASAVLSRHYTEATFLARHKLEELRIENQLQPGTQEGDFSGDYTNYADYADYRWETEIGSYTLSGTGAETEEAKFIPQTLQIRVKVSWNERGKNHSVELVTLSTSLQETES